MSLSSLNPHPRDLNISFREENHEYTIVGVDGKPTSVTTVIHRYFPEFNPDAIIKGMMSSRNWSKSKYYGGTAESIKQTWTRAAELGTLMHKSIEQYLNGEPVDNPETKEFSMFMDFLTEFLAKYPMLKLYRTEWVIYDETTGIAGSIDCVFVDPEGNLVIVDWKRSVEIKMENTYEKGYGPFCNFDNCNYSHYCLQLNFYRHMLETRYNKKVIFMMLVVLHPNQSSYQCLPIPHIDLSTIWPTLKQT